MTKAEEKNREVGDQVETLNSLLLKHPEWGDLPIIVASSDGFDWIGYSGKVYVDDEVEDEPVLVFVGN
jgi:hypothetical protein